MRGGGVILMVGELHHGERNIMRLGDEAGRKRGNEDVIPLLRLAENGAHQIQRDLDEVEDGIY